jgi:hypothetical protein
MVGMGVKGKCRRYSTYGKMWVSKIPLICLAPTSNPT